MGRMTIDNKLLVMENSFTDDSDLFLRSKLTAFIKKYGQFEEIVIARVENNFRVVSGEMILSLYRELDYGLINAYNLGELTRKEFIIARLLLTARAPRLNYLGIAEAISEICVNEVDCNIIANGTTINLTDVRRYKELLKFDWDEFSRKPLGNPQFDLFNNENDEL